MRVSESGHRWSGRLRNVLVGHTWRHHHLLTGSLLRGERVGRRLRRLRRGHLQLLLAIEHDVRRNRRLDVAHGAHVRLRRIDHRCRRRRRWWHLRLMGHVRVGSGLCRLLLRLLRYVALTRNVADDLRLLEGLLLLVGLRL